MRKFCKKLQMAEKGVSDLWDKFSRIFPLYRTLPRVLRKLAQSSFNCLINIVIKAKYLRFEGYCGVMGMQATSCTPLAGPVISKSFLSGRPFSGCQIFLVHDTKTGQKCTKLS
jgi:hypothetical protein